MVFLYRFFPIFLCTLSNYFNYKPAIMEVFKRIYLYLNNQILVSIKFGVPSFEVAYRSG